MSAARTGAATAETEVPECPICLENAENLCLGQKMRVCGLCSGCGQLFCYKCKPLLEGAGACRVSGIISPLAASFRRRVFPFMAGLRTLTFHLQDPTSALASG
jgi:hypothetical protein